MASALARIMPNVGGPSQSSRRLFSGAVNSMLLYAAPIWAHALGVQSYARGVKSVYRRSALRVARAFRTVSHDAVCVIADMPPIDLLAQERARLYRRKREGASNKSVIMKEEREVTLAQWQRRWVTSSTGRWTFSPYSGRCKVESKETRRSGPLFDPVANGARVLSCVPTSLPVGR